MASVPTNVVQEVEELQEIAREEVIDQLGQGFAKERCYHAITRGLVAQQLLKIVDPKHRSFGQFIQVSFHPLCNVNSVLIFLQEEILDPINKNRHAGVDIAEHYIGLPVDQYVY